jgi:hypothetical protein
MKKDYSRRKFVKHSSAIVLGVTALSGLSSFSLIDKTILSSANHSDIERIVNEIILHGRRNNQAWFEPAVGVIPGIKNKFPQIFIRATLLTGNDIGPQFYLKTDDLGKTWSNPILCQNWFKVPLEHDVFEEPWFGFFHHSSTNKFIAIGQTHFVRDAGKTTGQKNEAHFSSPDLSGSIVYSLWNPSNKDFDPWIRMRLPEGLNLGIYYNGQFHEKNDGTILIPGYYRGNLKGKEDKPKGRVTVIRCKFNGSELQYLEHGNILAVEEARGLAEPSIIYFRNKYFMTVRHDYRGYVTSSDNGLFYNDLKAWRFEDDEELGNYNTQQKWLKHNDALYLIYNRKSELNNGVFRSRAPLYIAEVDVDRLRIKRNTEKIVFPEKRARMGNFNIANVTKNESWVVTGEWLEGMFADSKKGDLFWVESSNINYNQYIGDLQLARLYLK